MLDPINITRKQIRERALGNSFRRGEALFENGAISSPVRRGNEISARCQGTAFQPYRVWAKLIDAEIYATSCDCPYDWGGDCKHIVAMLLTYQCQPEQFKQRKTLREELMPRKKSELIDIIEGIITRYPDLEEIVYRVATVGKAKQVVDLPAIQRELKGALVNRGTWMDHIAENKVYELASLGDRYAGRGETRQAIDIYCAILEECNNIDEYPTDDEGQYIDAVNHTVDRLKEALAQLDLHQHADLRGRLLELLVSAVIWDIDFGGVAYAADAPDMLLEIVKPADTPRIREQIRLAEARLDNSEYDRDFARDHFERFLMKLDEVDATTPEETLERLKVKQRHLLTANLLLTLRRDEEAVAVIAELPYPFKFREGLDLLVDHQQYHAAMQLAEAALEKDYDSLLESWLIKLYKRRGAEGAVYRRQLSRMHRNPQIENYLALRDAAKADGRWQSTRPVVISELKQKKEYAALAQVYLHEEEWDLAWEATDKAYQRVKGERSYIHYDLDFTVAEGSRHVRPARAIPVYVNYARGEIDHRTRRSYASAAELLREARAMYQQLGDSAGWRKLIAELRGEFKRLPALQDELDKAGL